MARGSSITSEKLEELGVRRLAQLLAEGCASDPVLAKRIRLALAASKGSGNLNASIGKRIASIARARTAVSLKRTRAFVRELDDLRDSIVNALGTNDPADAVETMWSFIPLIDGVLTRMEEGHLAVEKVFVDAIKDLDRLYLRVEDRDGAEIAERIFEALCGDSGYLFNDIKLLARALGSDGRSHLRSLLLSAEEKGVQSWRTDTALRELADAEGDVDAYILAVTGSNMRSDAAATRIAKRLLAADRAEEAISWLDRIVKPGPDFAGEAVEMRISALVRLGRKEEAQAVRLDRFRQVLDAELLRDYLKQLPDFEDFEAERAAIAHVETFPRVIRALRFLVNWPELEAAARLVARRGKEIDAAFESGLGSAGIDRGGRLSYREAYDLLNEAGDALSDRYPDAAVRLYRRVVDSVMQRGQTKFYGLAANSLGSCAALSDRTSPDSGAEGHGAYIKHLRRRYGRRPSFWEHVK